MSERIKSPRELFEEAKARAEAGGIDRNFDELCMEMGAKRAEAGAAVEQSSNESAPAGYIAPEWKPPKAEIPLEVLEKAKQRGIAGLVNRQELATCAPLPAIKNGDLLPPQGMVMRREEIVFQRLRNVSGIADSYQNALEALASLQISCALDTFHNKLVIIDSYRNEIGDGLDTAAMKVRKAALNFLKIEFSKKNVMDALETECSANPFNPVTDYLDGVRWDGTARVDDWLVRYCGAADTPYNRSVGRKMLLAAVRRARRPGCKFDYIVVLEGEQGIRKSTLLQILAGERNFSDAEILGMDKQEQQEAAAGIWIYELGELVGMSKTEITKIKQFASRQEDQARKAYGRDRVDQPRTCIFVATTNDRHYLRDTSGNRRFWPVDLWNTKEIDTEGVKRDRDQLWAESASLEATGESLVIPQELWGDAADVAASRMEIHPWMLTLEPALAEMVARGLKLESKYAPAFDEFGSPEWRVASAWLIVDVLRIPAMAQTPAMFKTLAGLMRQLGWEQPDTVMKIGKHVCRGFRKAVAREAEE